MLYSFTAIDRLGVTQRGNREAEDEKALARALRAEGSLLTASRPAKSGFSLNFSLTIGGVGLVDKMMFARNLAVMVGAGLSMTRALEALGEQSRNRKLKKIIGGFKDSITKGITFSDALEKEKNTFGDFFIHMVEAGEASGKLEESLKLLAKQMKRDHDLRSKVRGAMMYPSIVLTVLVLIGVLMLVYVVPTLTQTFKELGIELPPTTRLIIAASDFLRNHYVTVSVALIGVMAGVYRALKTKKGKDIFDRWVLLIPIFGPLVRKLNSARMARTLGSLIAAGLSITRSLDITGRVVGNVKFKESLEAAVSEIEKGRSLSVVLRNFPALYPPMVTEMVSVGEETGSLSRMLIRVALFYEEEVNNTTKNLSAIIEPIMMVAIGAIVAVFALSMIQPLYSSLAGI